MSITLRQFRLVSPLSLAQDLVAFWPGILRNRHVVQLAGIQSYDSRLWIAAKSNHFHSNRCQKSAWNVRKLYEIRKVDSKWTLIAICNLDGQSFLRCKKQIEWWLVVNTQNGTGGLIGLNRLYGTSLYDFLCDEMFRYIARFSKFCYL